MKHAKKYFNTGQIIAILAIILILSYAFLSFDITPLTQ